MPGNHELWTLPSDPVRLRGEERYRNLVAMCRRLGVITPEDPYPLWRGAGGPVVIAPLFLLYDCTFLMADTASAGRPVNADAGAEPRRTADRPVPANRRQQERIPYPQCRLA